jgi:hypothetical protein
MRAARRAGSLIVVLLAASAIAYFAGAVGSTAKPTPRGPTFREREALTAALPAYDRREPVGCVFLQTLVSSNGRYAQVTPLYLNASRMPCLRYAANGGWILEKTTRWRIIFTGSDPPPCSLHVPLELPHVCIP